MTRSARMNAVVRLAVVTGVLAVLAGCGAADAPKTLAVGSQRVPVSQLADVVPGLCRARVEAADVTAARSSFYNRSHAALHLIAVALEPAARPMAGRLLEAMQRVEADFARPAAPASLAPDLDRLSVVTRAGLAQLSLSASRCPKD